MSSDLLEPDRNVWRLDRAERAAVLLDAGALFGAVREALLKATSSVFIIGWDLDSRTRLVGENGTADDGLPETLVDFLSALVKRQPNLVVNILVWDYSVLYAAERELFPVLSLRWSTPRRIRYCLDDDLPLGASHHQKFVVVDDAVAFCGGLDLTIRRWDTCSHRLDDPHRTDPSGAAYPPFHDVQAIVDGAPARALGELARIRWERGACERAAPIRPTGNPWPDSVKPDLSGIDVGIARTFSASEEGTDVREVERLFFDMIDRAERTIYIENQFLTATRFAEHLAKRMVERPALEVVMVAPKAAHSWIEEQTMHAGLTRFMGVFAAAGLMERVRLFHPIVTEGSRSVNVMVHSKVMVVDDACLRVGSANLNNRSFGLDTECDLAFEAKTSEHRKDIARLRDRMVGHFCGVPESEVADALSHTGSFIKTAESLSKNGHSLQPCDLDGASVAQASALEAVADPERPIPLPEFLRNFVGERPRARRLSRVAKVVGIGFVVLMLVLAWQFTPLASLTDPRTVGEWLELVAETPAAPAIVLAIFVVGSLVAFPVTLLIAATAASFGPVLGFLYAATGAIAGAITTYGVGALIGRQALEDILGPRLNRIRRGFTRRGILAVAVVRMVPIAPFTLVNVAAGASKIPLTDFLLGTMIGMLPGLVLMSALGYQILSVLTRPTLANVGWFVLAVAAWIGVSIGAQALVLRYRKSKT
ncbi:MAG: VTT domain-containing protein [Xanthobacteraceae bacterium]